MDNTAKIDVAGLEAKIINEKQLIADAMNRIVDMRYEILLSKFHGTVQKPMTIGKGADKKTVIAKFGVYYDYFDGEDGDKIRVERKVMYELDGYRYFNKLEKCPVLTLKDINI